MTVQWPGQSPGSRNLQRLQQQQREQMKRLQDRQRMAGWDASRRTIDDDRRPDRDEPQLVEPSDRLGVVGRLVRFLLTIAFLAATVFMGFFAADVAATEGLEAALFPGIGALVGLLLTLRVRRWGRR